jgi:tryptophan synthase alpha chain
MPNKIDNCLAELRKRKRKAFIPYICAGDPSLEYTVDLALALEKSGADILELGVPFSDPLADGIVNQLAAQRALAGGATTRGVLDCVRQIRARSTIPIVLYTYLNPVLQFGWEKFHREAESAGVDGLLILDLPPEEDVISKLDGLKPSSFPVHIRLIAPTTPPERIRAIAKNARGFLYYVSREGVTGSREDVSSSLGEQLAQIRNISDLPIAVGFGISNADQAREVARHADADAIVVGSAIVDLIARHGTSAVEPVSAFACEIARAIN